MSGVGDIEYQYGNNATINQSIQIHWGNAYSKLGMHWLLDEKDHRPYNFIIVQQIWCCNGEGRVALDGHSSCKTPPTSIPPKIKQ